ncbi:hypothetical protein [Devosia naphthalenivorans]|nr:hypothetical protein [Devosia naphthalenivorans]
MFLSLRFDDREASSLQVQLDSNSIEQGALAVDGPVKSPVLA